MSRLPLPDLSLERFRRQLASVDALPQLCVLGVVSGLLAGGVMVIFRLLLSLGAWLLMPHGNIESFEMLSPFLRSLLPIVAVSLIGLWLWRQPAQARKVGIAHVIERLSYHQGRFPLRNWINQWWIGIVTVVGGLSAGREGPAIHLAAAASSGLGQRMRLPHNSLRVLVGCGTAAGISASFNTPIAGVIFAMEVVLMEYTTAGFLPVILASSTGAVIAQLVYGSDPAFQVPPVSLGSLVDLPWILLTGLIVGLLAGLFVHIARSGPRLERVPGWLRLAMVGVSVGAVAWWYPQVQGMGYDTLGATLTGDVAIDVLIAVAIGKLLLTAGAVACGVSVSIIGPVLVIGAAAGALCGMLGGWLWPQVASEAALYAMLGMAAMMGAVLQAPLAALMALLELTHNPNIILPGMLSVSVAVLTSRQLCGCQGFFITQTQHGLHRLQQPLMQALSRVAVPAVMERSLARTQRMISREQAQALLEDKPTWLVITRSQEEKTPIALKAADLARVMLDEQWADEESFDLLEIPGQRLELAPIHLQATLNEAFERLNEYGVDALYVQHTTAPLIQKISGIITRDAIESYYRYKR
ncbi:chloride channel protein [Halomonas sp. McH1-25]|uniref:chloride channel protein n=1 Tax=unclassified Halomonas TaxID=2609666 RepID=UPI001EF506ED|nr:MULTISPECIES: chloride channel protein [unclassified Halomonas]MCG7599638.1 chloride channel protein [Halomonas sp. McH1-25]MCP1342558.1 chloride channel protein [Halomonas sp. FL8]MCP1361410.1 chloride channel protein [Halomonas sp. BBD45]MCP1364610.1 chloride channel protein [Halomonas sp. BBD48]